MKPGSLRIRTYQVGFGDAFLLSFSYPDKSARHVLIDFGSTALPKGAPKDRMVEVAKDVRSVTGGKLHAVVATHRHKDHISGFTTNKAGDGSGDIIRSLNPDLVLQPWTEDPSLEREATGPAPSPEGLRFAALQSMQEVAGQMLAESARTSFMPKALRDEIEFLGDDNSLANRSAVVNLMTMGKERRYLNVEQDSGLDALLPGVQTIVLGPPNADQSKAVLKQRSEDENEFWHLRALTSKAAEERGNDRGASLFDERYVASDGSSFPEDTRWLIYRARKVQASQMLSLVRALDKAMNNTSLILLFRVGGKSLLFPGDAQIENWSYALADPQYRKMLAKVDLYKVGHHGSLNATPKSLWKLFDRKSPNPATKKRLESIMSTMPGKHGSEDKDTEVPRRTLTQELRDQSNLLSTHDVGPELLFVDKVIKF